VERQQGTSYQLSLFERPEDDVRHGVGLSAMLAQAGGEGGTVSTACVEPQASTALDREWSAPLKLDTLEPKLIHATEPT